MNLDDSAKVAREIEERNRKKRVVITSILLCIVLIAAMGIIIFFIKYNDSKTLKLYINGAQRQIPSTLFVESNGVKYVNINNLASLLDINYTKGKYLAYDEDENSCFFTSLHEVVAITGGETTYSKFLVDETESAGRARRAQAEAVAYGKNLSLASEQGTEEVHPLKYPIQPSTNGFYVAMEDVPVMFNIIINTAEPYRIRINTASSLFKAAYNVVSKKGYTTISYTYENMRALLDGYMVAGESGIKMGLINTTTGQPIISCKYEKFVYLQNAKEFFVYVNNSCALFSADGKQIIKTSEFDNIAVLDQGKTVDDRLYLVRKNGRYGVLNREGQVIIHPEYDYIGLKPEDFPRDSTNKTILSEVKNTKVLFDKVIPVKNEGKYGLFGLDGSLVAPIEYLGFGFMYTSEVMSTVKTPVSGQSGVLIIPESLGIQGIVMKRNEGYGIFDCVREKLIIPTNHSEIYKLLKGGVTTYYIVFDGNVMDLEQYLKDNKLISLKDTPTEKTATNEGTVYNEPVDLNGNTTVTNSTNTNSVDNESYIQYTPTEVTNSAGRTPTVPVEGRTEENNIPVETVPLN